MKTKDVPFLKQKVLDMLPITQADMWKKLGIDSREGSSLTSIMLEENLITRKRQKGVFLLERKNGNGKIIDIEITTEEELKKKEEAELKKKEEAELKKKEEAELKKKEEAELKKKEEEVPKKKARDTNSLKKQVMDILPIMQSEMWKTLGITSSAGARLVDTMLEENLITRKKHDNTFILEAVGKRVEKKKDYNVMLSGKNRFSPCCGCLLECDAAVCHLLTEWLLE